MARELTSSPPLTFPAGDVVKQGYLFVKRPPRKYFHKMRAWHKRYLVLRDETQDRSPSLEMYEKDELLTAPLGLTGPKLIMDLGQCVHIGFTSDSTKFPYALVIVCQGRSPLILAAEDELSARSWLLALGLITHKGSAAHCQRTSFIPPPSLLPDGNIRRYNRNKPNRDTCSLPQESSTSLSMEGTAASLLPEEYNDSDMDLSYAREIFHVTVNPTEDSQRLGMTGDLQLAVFSHGLGLAKTGMASCFVVWPVAYIRQYLHESTATTGRSKTTIVTLEVGRRSSTGEGVFQFRTQRGQEIIRELKAIVELWSARKAVLSIQQFSAKHSSEHFLKGSPGKGFPKCTQWSITGRSAPCTPSLAFPHNWHKLKSSPGISSKVIQAQTVSSSNSLAVGGVTNHVSADKSNKTESTEVQGNVNYIVPCFGDSSPPEAIADCGDLKSPRTMPRKPVTADVGKDGCVRTKHTRIIGACSIPENRCSIEDNGYEVSYLEGDDEEECCYIEVEPGKGPKKGQIPLTAKPSKKKAVTTAAAQEPEAYLEVLPA